MRSNEVRPPVTTKRYSSRTIASSVLGVISIISASMALIMTISMKDAMKEVSGGGGWVFVFFLVVIPLMLLSFITSIIGICLSTGTLKGKMLNISGLMLTFSPILMVIIIMKIQNWQRETHDKKNYSYVDEVKFNKEKKELIKYSRNKKVTNYTIPDSVTDIKDNAFLDCKSLTKITIPDSVTSIGDGAFQGCSSLTTITIPDSVTSIGDYAFSQCKSLTTITIPDSVTSIRRGAFAGCENLKSIPIPDTVTNIGENAFRDCRGMASITFGINSNLTSIGENAFSGCNSLRSITIPESVNMIEQAFNDCDELRIISFLDSNPPANVNNVLSNSSKAAIRIKSNATGFGEVFGGLPVIDPNSNTEIQSIELDKNIEHFLEANEIIYNVRVKVTVRSDVPVELVSKNLFGPEGSVYEKKIVTEFKKGRFPDGRLHPDIWIFEWEDSIPASMLEDPYKYSQISVTNFDGMVSKNWPDLLFKYNELESSIPERPVQFDGNYVNWEFVNSNKGYGFFEDENFPYLTFNVTGDISSLGIVTEDIFDHPPFERLFGDADYVENNRLQCTGNGTAFFNIVFSDTVPPKSLGLAVTDLDLENVIIRAWHKSKPIGKTTINRWFRESFDSKGKYNKPSWDPEHNAIVAQRDMDGLLSKEQLTSSGSESPSAWFFPDVPFDSLSLEYHNRLSGRSSMHVYLASQKKQNTNETDRNYLD